MYVTIAKKMFSMCHVVMIILLLHGIITIIIISNCTISEARVVVLATRPDAVFVYVRDVLMMMMRKVRRKRLGNILLSLW